MDSSLRALLDSPVAVFDWFFADRRKPLRSSVPAQEGGRKGMASGASARNVAWSSTAKTDHQRQPSAIGCGHHHKHRQRRPIRLMADEGELQNAVDA